MCFGGNNSSPAPVQAAPAPTNTPAPAGSDSEQRFKQIRAGLTGDQGTLIDSGTKSTKGATVLGETG